MIDLLLRIHDTNAEFDERRMRVEILNMIFAVGTAGYWSQLLSGSVSAFATYLSKIVFPQLGVYTLTTYINDFHLLFHREAIQQQSP